MKPLTWSLISSVALTANAAAVSSLSSLSPLADRNVQLNGRAISTSMLTTLDFYAQYAAASYCNSDRAVGSTVACSDSACPLVTSAGAKITATFKGDKTDIQGFVSTDATNKVIVLSIRGSASLRNWITDFVFVQKICTFVFGCKVHLGFAIAWDEISTAALAAVRAAKTANPTYKIVFTGHSLGGAVSQLGAVYARQAGLAVDMINYGSPRVGNAAFATFASNQAGVEYRVTHLDDPVPRLPPIIFNYAHTTPEYWLSNGEPTTSEYTPADVKVCTGVKALGCNALTLGLEFDSHTHYLGKISGCSADNITVSRRDLNGEDVENRAVEDENYEWWQGTAPATDVSDAKLEAMLNSWVELDAEASA